MNQGTTFTTDRFIKDTLFASLPLPFQKLRTYVWLVLFTRLLQVEGFGEWSLFMTTLGIMLNVAAMRMGTAMMRFLGGSHEREDLNAALSTVLLVILTTSGIGALGCFLLADKLAGAIFGAGGSSTVIYLMGATLVSDLAFEELKGFLRAQRRNRNWAGVVLARLFLETALTIAAAYLYRSTRAVVLAYWGCSVVSTLALLGYLRWFHDVRFAWPRLAIFRRYTAFGCTVQPGTILFLLSSSVDRYILSSTHGLESVGAYTACVTIAASAFFFVGPINDVLFPELSALYDQDQADLFRRRLSGIQKITLAVSFGIATLLVAFPSEILNLATLGRLTTGQRALQLLGIQSLGMGIVMLYICILEIKLKVWSSAFVWKGMAVTVVALDFILIPAYGIEGAAVAQLTATFVAAAILLWMNFELVQQTFRAGWFLQLALCSALVWGAQWTWPAVPPSLGQAASKLALAAALFLAGLFATSYLRVSEVRLLYGVLFPARK